MKRISLLAILVLCLAAPSLMRAQTDSSHVEVGVFADYLRLDAPTPAINFVGVGGRVGFNVSTHVALEAQMSYDFARNFTTVSSNGGTTTFVTTRFRPLDGLFGPAFKFGTGAFDVFATGKVGFISFTSSNQGVANGFQSGLGAIENGNTRFAVYPGAGVEGFWGPFGLRLDVGDEIYFDSGAQNNIKVEFGPHFRF